MAEIGDSVVMVEDTFRNLNKSLRMNKMTASPASVLTERTKLL